MRPIALLVNDLHICKDNISDFKKNWDEMVSVCKANGIGKVFIGGDVFTTRGVQALPTMMAVNDCFRHAVAVGLELHVVNGNHDKVDCESEFGWCHIFSFMVGVHVYGSYKRFSFQKFEFVMFPYFPEEAMMPAKLAELDEELKSSGVDFGDVVLYLHAGVHGALGDFDIPNEIPQDLLVKYGRVLCGHYHNRTIVADTNIEYVGSSRANTFGEDEEKGYTILYEDGSTKFVKNEANDRYVTVDLPIADIAGWKREYDERYKVRLRIHCTSVEAETVDREDLLARGANKIEFDTEKIQAIAAEQSDFEEKFDTQNLQSEYKVYCGEKGIDSRLGIDYLNKI